MNCCARPSKGQLPRNIDGIDTPPRLTTQGMSACGSSDEEFYTPPASEVGSDTESELCSPQEIGKRPTNWSQLQMAEAGCPLERRTALSMMASQTHQLSLAASHPNTYYSLATLHRFLKARDYDVQKAVDMFTAHVAWRATTLPIVCKPSQQQALQAAQTANAPSGSAARRFYRVQGHGTPGQPIVICCVLRQWVNLSDSELDDALGAYIAFIEETARLADSHPDCAHRGQWTLICDCAGLGLRTVPMTFLKRINAIFEPNYPERLRASVMVPVPKFIVKIVKAMMVFVAEATRRKFVMVATSKDLAAASGVSENNLPSELAGW